MHHSSESIYMAVRDQAGPGRDGFWPKRHAVQLADFDTSWNPASTSQPIHGPGTVTYTEHADGGWTVTVDRG